jgi:hypothetical protein
MFPVLERQYVKGKYNLWCLTSGATVTQCGAQNAERQVPMTAMVWPHYAAVIAILVSCTSCQTFKCDAKGLIKLKRTGRRRILDTFKHTYMNLKVLPADLHSKGCKG